MVDEDKPAKKRDILSPQGESSRRISISLRLKPEFVRRIDDEAVRCSLSRTAWIAVAVAEKLKKAEE